MSTRISDTETPRQTLVALFATRDDADLGMTRLLSVGLPPENIGLLEPADQPGNPALRSSVAIAIGAALGAIAGAGMGLVAVGLASVGMAIVAGLTGIAFGGWGGAALGSYFGAGRDSDDDPYFLRAIQDGRILVSAEVPDRQSENVASAVLHDSRAIEVDSLGSGRLHLTFRHPSLSEEVA